MIVTILLLVTIACLLLFIGLLQFDYDDAAIVFIMLTVCGAIGFGVSSCALDQSSMWIEMAGVSYAKSHRVVVVDDGMETWLFVSHKAYSEINDSTKFYREHTTNFWGYRSLEDFKYQNADSTSKILTGHQEYHQPQ